ncbi:hypothetical protein AB0N79_37370, partial [Streptomyces microflavus]|uniref:hypothetical protein n=1 Tax=Streptomyces microflavus TaxID=1919 RepID=UPI00342E025D
SDGSTGSALVTLLLVIDASSMIGSYTERFTVPPMQPLSRAAVVNARIRELMDRPDLDEADRARRYTVLLEDWAQATHPCPAPVRAA